MEQMGIDPKKQIFKICSLMWKCCEGIGADITRETYIEILDELKKSDIERKINNIKNYNLGDLICWFSYDCNKLNEILIKYIKIKMETFSEEEYKNILFSSCLYCANSNTNEKLNLVNLLLEYQIKNPKQISNGIIKEAFNSACLYNKINVIKIFLDYFVKYSSFNTFTDENILYDICLKGHIETLELLLSNPNFISITTKNLLFFRLCCCDPNQVIIAKIEKIITILLEYSVKYKDSISKSTKNKAYFYICSSGNNKFLKILLEHSIKYPDSIDIKL
jgi:hypothetical protein